MQITNEQLIAACKIICAHYDNLPKSQKQEIQEEGREWFEALGITVFAQEIADLASRTKHVSDILRAIVNVVDQEDADSYKAVIERSTLKEPYRTAMLDAIAYCRTLC